MWRFFFARVFDFDLFLQLNSMKKKDLSKLLELIMTTRSLTLFAK